MSEITYYQKNRDHCRDCCENKQKINIDHYQTMKKI